MSTTEIPADELVVPTPDAIVELRMSDGAPIRLRRYGSGPVRLLLSHGNGLAINAYTPFWEPLIDDFELVVFDIRNHGENPLHDPRQHNWPRITQDIGEIFAGTQRQFGQNQRSARFTRCPPSRRCSTPFPAVRLGMRSCCSIRRSFRRPGMRCNRHRSPTWRI